MFIPKVDQLLTVTLPGETLRAPVVQIIDRRTVFVRLDGHPLNPGKAHSYRMGDTVACRRKQNELGEFWEAMDDRVLFAREQPVKEPPLPVAKRKTVKKTAQKGARRAPAIRK